MKSAPTTLASELRPVLLHLARQLRRELEPLGITGAQASLLAAIHARPGIGVRELALLEGASRPVITTSIDRLERAGLVRRRRCESDARRVEIEISEKGRQVLAAARSLRTAWLTERLGRLTPEERASVASAVEPLRRLLGPDA
jgi:DNA-binding MarR family transcriptional regulator